MGRLEWAAIIMTVFSDMVPFNVYSQVELSQRIRYPHQILYSTMPLFKRGHE